MKQSKIAALASIRNQLGKKITTGAEWVRVQESREDWQGYPGGGQEQPALTRLDEEAATREGERLYKVNELCLGNGIPRGHLTEITEGAGENASAGGAGLALAAILAQARRARQYVMLFDVGAGFSVESFPEQDLESLLWVGCASASEAIEALDIASRDENFALFLLDFRNCEPGEWRSVRAQQWYRVLGQMRQRGSAAVIFSEVPVTSVSRQKWEVRSAFACQDLYRERAHLWQEMRLSRVTGGSDSGRKTIDYRQKAG